MKIKAFLHLTARLVLTSSILLIGSREVTPPLRAQAAPQFATTLTVTSTADAGPGTLRDAIESANTIAGPDAIVFDIVGAITLATPLPVIAEDLSIDGKGQLIDIHADTTFRIFEAPAGVTWRAAYLVLQAGYADRGGAILNGGALEIQGCSFLSNGAAFGSAIYNTGDLVVSNSSFAGNSSYGGQGGAN